MRIDEANAVTLPSSGTAFCDAKFGFWLLSAILSKGHCFQWHDQPRIIFGIYRGLAVVA